MTWEAKLLPSQRAEGWVASSDVTLVPPLAALTPDEQAAFIQARDAWITAARTFIAHKAGAVSGRIVGYRHERSAFGRPDAQIIMEFGLWRLSNVTQPQRLDLAEGKRLLSEWRADVENGHYKFLRPADRLLAQWFNANADSLIAAAEEAEKLREAAQRLLDAWGAPVIAGEYVSPVQGAIEQLRALTQPEPTPGASSSS